MKKVLVGAAIVLLGTLSSALAPLSQDVLQCRGPSGSGVTGGG